MSLRLLAERRTHLEALDVLHLGGLARGDAGVEEGGCDGDAEGLGRHAGLGGLAVGVDDAEGAEEEDQQVLRVHRQRGEHPASMGGRKWGSDQRWRCCCWGWGNPKSLPRILSLIISVFPLFTDAKVSHLTTDLTGGFALRGAKPRYLNYFLPLLEIRSKVCFHANGSNDNSLLLIPSKGMFPRKRELFIIIIVQVALNPPLAPLICVFNKKCALAVSQ